MKATNDGRQGREMDELQGLRLTLCPSMLKIP